jgi:hypothetical protein
MSKTLAVMQPYFFPYIGYFQLLNLADTFVFYDDVTYIKQGWISRNRLLVEGHPHLFSVPLRNASSNVLIADLLVAPEVGRWLSKFERLLTLNYRKAPFFDAVMEIVLASCLSGSDRFMDWLVASHCLIVQYLSIETRLILSSSSYGNRHLNREERLIDICKRESCDTYVNPAGGRALYAASNFAKEGIKLCFLEPKNVTYSQFSGAPVSGLSIIDVLMFNSASETRSLLESYRST